VGLNRLVGRHPATFGDARLDQQPWRVTYGSDGFTGLIEGVDESKRARVDTQQVRVDLPPRQYDGVVIVGAHVGESLVDLHRRAPIGPIPPLDLALLRRNDVDLRPRSAELVAWNLKLRLFEA